VIALYLPGTSLLHRARAGVKLLGLVVLALLISLWPHTAIAVALTGALVIGL
jgi:biotin transport system permease protein